MKNETKWVADYSHSEITFKVKHLMISSIKGVFKRFETDISIAEDDFLTANLDITIDPSSIETGDAKRDEHLKSTDFFDVTNHRQITFSNATIEKSQQNDALELWGDLSMKGISKRVKLDLEYGGKVIDPSGNEKMGFTINGKINRKDWQLNWNNILEGGGLLVSEEVTINCDIQLVRETNQEMQLVEESLEHNSAS
jgi:polyisoprenoid-binding protein YceI